MSISRDTLRQALDTLLQPERFKDYGPNGLQVEGKDAITRIVSGVTASRALIDAAIAERADAIFVHHGLFWRGQDGRVTGWMKQRLQRLLAHDINLFAYHLPLDAHPELATTHNWGSNWAGSATRGLASRTLGAWLPSATPACRLWRSMWVRCWGAQPPLLHHRRIARWRVWPGVRVARKAILKRRLPLVPMPL